MRVVHVVTRSHHRGAEVVALELARALDEIGHENHVLAIGLGADGREVEDLAPLVRSARINASTLLRGWWRLRTALADRPADIVVAHGGAAAILVALPGGARRAARVWQRILGLPVAHLGALRRLSWFMIARQFDGVVALSRQLEIEVRGIGYRGPVWVIPNARDPRRFAEVNRTEASTILRGQLGLDEDAPLLAFVGHMVAQKQPELAVDVLAEVLTNHPRAHLVMAGDGDRRPSVARRASELGVERSVTLLGHRDDPEVVFAAADLALITSEAEGVPGVAIEAHMAACPVVSFDVGAITDVVEDGVTGAVVVAGDTSRMAARVSDLLSRPRELRAMGEEGAARSSAFTMASVAALYAARFTELT